MLRLLASVVLTAPTTAQGVTKIAPGWPTRLKSGGSPYKETLDKQYMIRNKCAQMTKHPQQKIP